MRLALLLFISLFPLFSFAAVTAWVPFTLENGHIKIQVVVDGIETNALLDTGAQINTINQAFLNKHDLSYAKGAAITLTGVFGEKRVSRLNAIPLNIFGTDIELDGVVPSSFGHHSTGLIIGAGFFSQFIVQIDYPNEKMRVMTRDALDLKKYQNIRTESNRGTGEPLVRVSVGEDASFWALLDTGSNGGVLVERSHASRLGLLDKVTNSGISAGVNSLAVTESTRVDEFTFGPYTLENVLVSFPAERQKINMRERTSVLGSHIKSQKQQGILGYDILKHFILTLDYKRGRAHVGLPE
jgi:predicted aspartyl protease